MGNGLVRADWIAVDWGTSHVRAWAMAGDGSVQGAAQSDQGMAGLDRAGFEPALLDLIGDWVPDDGVPIVACGMVGARQGWIEAPYLQTPCAPLAGGFVQPAVDDPRLRIWIAPGVSQSDPADVMRGEETQIAGFVAARPKFQGVLCLPGTHAKWVTIAEGQIQHFSTAMTGEVFALLAEQSVLRHTAGEGWDDDAFAAAVREAYADPSALIARLFSVRAGALLSDPVPGAARARLSGLLIGAEIAAARPVGNVVLLGDAALSGRYRTALTCVGLEADVVDGEAATLDGLRRAKDLVSTTEGLG